MTEAGGQVVMRFSAVQWRQFSPDISASPTRRRRAIVAAGFGCTCPVGRRSYLDFGEATRLDEGRWARLTLIATAGLDIGRDLARPFSPGLGLKVEEGCRPCVLRPPAP